MKALFRRMKGSGKEAGAALALVAASVTVLMGMAAFGTDLAWFYLNASRIQRAADAGSLAGVVWMPTDLPTASSTALATTQRNGYEDGTDFAVVTPAAVVGEINQLQVTVSDTVDTFFIRLFGFQDMTITRTAVAEYVPPLKLGSPDNQFGNSCDPEQAGCTGQANFWANIHGKWTSTIMGDAYSSYCANANDIPSCAQNPLARDTGYLYGVEANGQPSFTVQFNDVQFHNTSGGNPTGDGIRTGDRGCEDWGPSMAPDCGATMYVALYAPDPTPLDISDNTLLCSATLGPLPQVPDADPYSWFTPAGCFTVNTPTAGTYVVQIRHVNPGSVIDRSGLNRYSIRSSPGSQLFALGDFSIYNNADGSTTDFYLAEVPDFYAGKTLVVELYDPGESAANGTLQVLEPSGAVFDLGECRVYDRNNPTQPWVLQNTIPSGSNCQELVNPGEYNGRWLKFEMDLPVSYSCGACWWKMNYVYTSSVNDTTTWRAYIIGNPIHLVPSP